MPAPEDRHGHSGGEDSLFDEIREYLSDHSIDRIHEDLAQAYGYASTFVERELRGIDEYDRMIRALERLVVDIFGEDITGEMRSRVAETLYLYGLAHYTLMQQVLASEDGEEEGEEGEPPPKPLVIYDVWFPTDVAIERAQDGLYLHVSDGRIDVSIFLGGSPNERGTLVDLVDHWGFAASSADLAERESDLSGSVPMMTIEIDYNGSELVDAEDHVDVLFFDHEGEPVVRMHARASDLRTIIDELQAAEREDGL
jgi:hypothetical protein